MPRKPGPDPREWLVDAPTWKKWQRTGFGDQTTPGNGWLEPENAQEKALVAAAQNQHRLAMHIRLRMQRSGMTAVEVADQLDMSDGYLLDILSGSTHVYLADLHRLAAVFGIEFHATFKPPSKPE